MKLSVEWLRDHVAVGEDVDGLAKRLTSGGHAVDAVAEVEGSAVLELDITANRPDCLNVRGLAREVSALCETPLIDLAPMLALTESGPPIAELFALQNDIPDLCRRFAARVVRGVKPGPSPEWLAARLRRAGQRPISNLVDLTNYVMLELGHPMHAFDLATLRGGKLQVRMARQGEVLRTLDGVDRKLQDWMILIADGERPVSLAGVMGGAETEISDDTTDVLLEAAWWDPVTIFRTGRALGLSSDAAYRFERGADPEAAAQALDRCARLMVELAGGEIATGVVDDHPRPFAPRKVALREERLGMLLGLPVSADQAAAILERLSFLVENKGEVLEVTVPSFRADVVREEDLIEEIGRVIGYDEVPEVLPAFSSGERGRSPERMAEHEVRRQMQGAGFLEALNYSFVARQENRTFSAWPDDVVALSNPMSELADVLRGSLLPGLVRNAAHNFKHGAERVRLYEIARVFRQVPGQELPEERKHLGLIAYGTSEPADWSRTRPAVADLYDLKGTLEEMLGRQGLPAPVVVPGGPSHLDQGTALTWSMDGREIGWIGMLSEKIAAAYELEPPTALAEVHLGALLAIPVPPVEYREIPRYPSITRDLSLVLPHSCLYAEVEGTIRGAGGDWITSVAPFDRFAGEELPADSIALGVRISFQHPSRTLVSGEVDEAQQAIVKALEQDLGARLRE